MRVLAAAAGLALAAAAASDATVPFAAAPFNAPKPYPHYSVWIISWATVAGATDYRIWLDGKPVSLQPATAGPTQGSHFAVACGVQHRVNLQAHSPAGYGALNPQPTYWTPPPC